MKKNIKRCMLVCISLITVGILVACTKNSKTSEDVKEKKSVFDKTFYDGAKSVELVGSDMVIEDTEVIEEIKNYILSAKISRSNKNIFDYYGTTMLVFNFDDGSSKTVSMTSELILDLGVTYDTENDICTEIKKIFIDKWYCCVLSSSTVITSD